MMIKTAKKKCRKGAALLVVLFIVMAITVISLGVIARSDIELISGQNVELRMAMDYLAESGLEHAKGMLLNPQEVSGEYWTGATGLQLVAGSDDYYDVSVTKFGECNYQITSAAYRQQNGEQTGQSSLTAQLRLDPCIAMRVGDTWTTEARTSIYGDVYGRGDLRGSGYVAGDAYANGWIFVATTGQQYQFSPPPVSFPNLLGSDYYPRYYIGTNMYTAGTISSGTLNRVVLGPTTGNPAGVYYANNALDLYDNVVIRGTLIVNNDLKIRGRGNIIIASKNFPALVVSNKLKIYDQGQLSIEGLVQIRDAIEGSSAVGMNLSVSGAVFIRDHNIDGLESLLNSIVFNASPNKAAIQRWYADGTVTHWSPAAAAFFKSITRNP